jgi:hypothetical protein
MRVDCSATSGPEQRLRSTGNHQGLQQSQPGRPKAQVASTAPQGIGVLSCPAGRVLSARRLLTLNSPLHETPILFKLNNVS